MAKIISVSNETYENLTKIKGKNSFSEVIILDSDIIIALLRNDEKTNIFEVWYGKIPAV